MKNTREKIPSADALAEMVDAGKDVSGHFTNKGKMMPAIKRVNVDFTVEMLEELDAVVKETNISRQAVIKSFLRQSLDQHYLARKSRRAS